MSPSCKYSNVQSFFGVKPYCDLGAIGAKGGELGNGVRLDRRTGDERRRGGGGEGDGGSTFYELSSASRAFCFKTMKEDLALSTASAELPIITWRNVFSLRCSDYLAI